jgi:aminoglycoside phosphotransferase (APT) family kinase protein
VPGCPKPFSNRCRTQVMRNRFGQLSRPAVSGVDLAGLTGNVAELAASCQAWGTALATLHTMSTRRSVARLAPRPVVLNPRHLMPSRRDAGRGSGYATVLEAYESSPDLRAAASEVDDRWTEQHWIHGNLTASIVILEQRPALQVSFADMEDAGLGDPAWDLASAAETIAWLSPRWHAMPQLLMDNLLLGYRRAGGPGRLYPAMQAVRALASALQVAGSEQSNRPAGERADLIMLLDRARAYAARVGLLRAVA